MQNANREIANQFAHAHSLFGASAIRTNNIRPRTNLTTEGPKLRMHAQADQGILSWLSELLVFAMFQFI